MDEYSDATPVASVDGYIKALQHVKETFGLSRPFSVSKELKMLKAHYASPNHTITTANLAAHAGFVGHGTAHTHYGKFAHRIADKLGYRPATSSAKTQDPHWWRTLAHGNPGAPLTNDGSYQWVMRPELCAALEKLGWVKKAS